MSLDTLVGNKTVVAEHLFFQTNLLTILNNFRLKDNIFEFAYSSNIVWVTDEMTKQF